MYEWIWYVIHVLVWFDGKWYGQDYGKPIDAIWEHMCNQWSDYMHGYTCELAMQISIWVGMIRNEIEWDAMLFIWYDFWLPNVYGNRFVWTCKVDPSVCGIMALQMSCFAYTIVAHRRA